MRPPSPGASRFSVISLGLITLRAFNGPGGVVRLRRPNAGNEEAASWCICLHSPSVMRRPIALALAPIARLLTQSPIPQQRGDFVKHFLYCLQQIPAGLVEAASLDIGRSSVLSQFPRNHGPRPQSRPATGTLEDRPHSAKESRSSVAHRRRDRIRWAAENGKATIAVARRASTDRRAAASVLHPSHRRWAGTRCGTQLGAPRLKGGRPNPMWGRAGCRGATWRRLFHRGMTGRPPALYSGDSADEQRARFPAMSQTKRAKLFGASRLGLPTAR